MSGNIHKLNQFIDIHKEQLDEIHIKYTLSIALMENNIADYEDGDLSSVYGRLLGKWHRPYKNNTYKLSDQLHQITTLYKQLGLEDFRNQQIAHYDTKNSKGVSIDNAINLGFFLNPDFQKLLTLVDNFLSDCNNKIYGNTFPRNIYTKSITNHYKIMIDDYVEKQYLEIKTKCKLNGENFDDSVYQLN